MKRKASQQKISIETNLKPKKTSKKIEKVESDFILDRNSKLKSKVVRIKEGKFKRISLKRYFFSKEKYSDHLMNYLEGSLDEEFFKSRHNKNLSKAKPGTKSNKQNKNIDNKIDNLVDQNKNESSKGKNKLNNDVEKENLKAPYASSKSLCIALSNIEINPKKKDRQSHNSSSSDESFSKNIIKSGFDNNIKTLIAKKDFGPRRIRLGLCCMNNFLRNQKKSIFCARSIILSTFLSKGAELAMEKALENVKDILKLLIWNKMHHIEVMRVSSDLFPHYTNIYLIPQDKQYTLDFAKEELKKIGDYAKQNNMRLTMHPGQFNVLATKDDKILKRTVADLKMHADILDYMGLDGNSIMVIHGGGTYGEKEKTIQRWIENYANLSDQIKNRLVLENCEKNFSIEDCLRVSKATGIPVVFDTHHFKCYKKFHPEETFQDIRVYIKASIETWIKKGLRPKFHISEQDTEKVVGAHSKFVKKIPEYYIEIPQKLGIGIDLMIEAKGKEAAILYLFRKYKKEFLNHISESEIPKDFFDFDEKNMQARKCSRCNLDFEDDL